MKRQSREGMLAAVIHRAAVVRGLDVHVGDDLGVRKTGAHAALDLFQEQVGRHDRWQAVDIAVVENLEEFLPRPRRGALCAEVVHDQQRCVANPVEARLKGFALVRVGEAELIEQVGDGEEERGEAVLDAVIGDGGGEVCLAAAVAPLDEQPAFAVLGECASLVVGALDGFLLLGAQPHAAAGIEALKGQVPELVELAHAEEAAAHAFLDLTLAAGAYLQAAEFRVSERQILAQIAQPVAEGALGIAKQRGSVLLACWPARLRRLPRSRRIALGDISGELSQCLLDLLAHPCLVVANPRG